jgi:mediator of RNA polymerase II transcription subunit 13, fungi type
MLIPEVFLSHFRTLSQNVDFGMDRLAMTVYDAFPRTVFRQYSRLSAKKNGADEIFDAFAFVLAGRRPPKAVFVEKWPPPTSNMFDRYAFLHAAYNISANGEWVVASLVTGAGDDVESQVWRVDEHDALNSIVRNVLDFVLKHALRADVEWRITLSKSGIMSPTELNGKPCL